MVLCDYMDVRSGVNLIFSAYVTWGGVGVCVLCFSMEGGELFSRIQERGDQAFTERGEKSQV